MTQSKRAAETKNPAVIPLTQGRPFGNACLDEFSPLAQGRIETPREADQNSPAKTTQHTGTAQESGLSQKQREGETQKC